MVGKKHPIFLVSEYGDLLNIRPILVSKTYKTGKSDFREVKLIGSNHSAKDVIKQLNKHPNTFFLFDP